MTKKPSLEELQSVFNTHRATFFYNPKRLTEISQQETLYRPHEIQVLEAEILYYLSEKVTPNPTYSCMTLDQRGVNMALEAMGQPPIKKEARITRKEAFDYFVKEVERKDYSRNLKESNEMQEKYQKLQTMYIQLEKEIKEESKKPPKPLSPIVKEFLAWRAMRESRN